MRDHHVVTLFLQCIANTNNAVLRVAVHQERCSWLPGMPVPGEQVIMIGVGGKPVQGMYLCANLDFLAEYAYPFRSLDDSSTKRVRRGKPDKDDTALLAPEIMFQMMTDASARAHSGPCQHHGATDNVVDGHRRFW